MIVSLSDIAVNDIIVSAMLEDKEMIMEALMGDFDGIDAQDHINNLAALDVLIRYYGISGVHF